MSIQGNGLEMISGHMTTSMVGIEMDLKQDLTDSSLVLVADGVEIIQFNSQAMNRFNLSVQAPREFLSNLPPKILFFRQKTPFDQKILPTKNFRNWFFGCPETRCRIQLWIECLSICYGWKRRPFTETHQDCNEQWPNHSCNYRRRNSTRQYQRNPCRKQQSAEIWIHPKWKTTQICCRSYEPLLIKW